MAQDSIRVKIRTAILGMEKPFCITDLFLRFEKQGITDREIILSVLDELYDEGFIEYDRVSGTVDDPDNNASSWAFKIA